MVRRLCVTPAVGSLMQWLLTRRNRTTELSTDHEHVNTTQSSSPVRSDNVSGNWSEGATGKNAAAVAGTVEAREGGGACHGAPPTGVRSCDSGGVAKLVRRVSRYRLRFCLERYEQQWHSGYG